MSAKKQKQVVVIGAGVGGLTTAALLVQAGYAVTVLEAHIYPGGSAGTFYHQGYRFDAGATLAGGFSTGGPHARLAEQLGITWPVQTVDPAWIVHLPDDRQVRQPADAEHWRAERETHFPGSDAFWEKQEMLADLSWDISARTFPWPPENVAEAGAIVQAFRPRLLKAVPYLTRTIGDLIPPDRPDLKTFLDAQLLIAAQTTADKTNALYGSAALDLPRRGVNHVQGGMGGIAKTLVRWIREHGGEVHYRQKVERIEVANGRAVAVHTNKKQRFAADWLVANLTPWALHNLLGEQSPRRLAREVEQRQPTWGAFTLYLGLDAAQLSPTTSHHQVIMDADQPLGEGNTVFISLSAAADRAPAGHIAATLSTHTAIQPWWRLRHGPEKSAYLDQRHQYTEKLLAAAERAVPGIRLAIRLCLPGTPVTFEFYTRRPGGMVGGFPQTSLFNVRGPGTGIPNVKLVGDSIFPGQSTAGVTLGGMRVADTIVRAGRLSALTIWKGWAAPNTPEQEAAA